jgi:cytochrome c biogenesis protein CcmG, thiol:disulfide interchange protein DsbE
MVFLAYLLKMLDFGAHRLVSLLLERIFTYFSIPHNLMKKLFVFILVFSFSISLMGQMALAPQYKGEKTRPEPRAWDKVGKIFPFDIPLEDTARMVYKSDNLLQTNGKPLVLMFWLTTCGPCKMELRTINENYEAWKKQTDFRMLAISTDWEDNWPRVVERVAAEQWKFETYRDFNMEFQRILPGGLNGLPQVFVFDKTGRIVYHHRRFMPGDEVELLAKIKEANL